MIGIRGMRKIRGVTADASYRRAGEAAPGVTAQATGLRMHAREREPGRLVVIEAGSKPTVHSMAVFARCGKLRRQVIRSLGLLEVSLVAGYAGSAEAAKQADRRALVA